jgi:hypothetical protein
MVAEEAESPGNGPEWAVLSRSDCFSGKLGHFLGCRILRVNVTPVPRVIWPIFGLFGLSKAIGTLFGRPEAC